MSHQSPIDQSIDRLVLVRKVAAFANLGVYAGPAVIDQALASLNAVGREGLRLVQCRSTLEAMSKNMLPSQATCQAGVAEVDGLLLPLRAQRRSATEISARRPRPS